jgi:hypothetical protein
MAGKQYTKCVSKANYDGLCGVWPDLLYAFLYGLFGGGAGALLGIILAAIAATVNPSIEDATFQCIALATAVTGFMVGFADGLQERFENQRLICIAEDQCAIGRMAFHKTGPSKGVPEGIDNDYTLNLILVPHAADSDPATVWNDGAQGQQFLQQRFSDLSYSGYPGHPDTLHCEFEGNRMRAICNAIRAAAPLFGLAACSCLAVGAWCILIFAILAFLTFLAGWLAGEDGSPADAADDADSGTLEDGDCIVVRGHHIYDAGHCEGWHEIHPVLHVQKLCSASDSSCLTRVCFEADPTDPAVQQSVRDLVDAWCAAIGQTTDPITIEKQQQPENRWCFHPDVDGCQAPAPIP